LEKERAFLRLAVKAVFLLSRVLNIGKVCLVIRRKIFISIHKLFGDFD